jgi:hypothetical protein
VTPMPSRPTRKQIDEADRYQLKRQADFRLAADAVAAALSQFPEVRAIALFGSVARPLEREVPRFEPFRRHGVEILHECKDVDLAVWLDRTDGLAALGRARGQAVGRLLAETGVGVAHHQVDIFLFEPATNAYLGRLCSFGECPKGKRDCEVPGCGRAPFLKQHEGFVLYPEALEETRIVRLFDRERGWRTGSGRGASGSPPQHLY